LMNRAHAYKAMVQANLESGKDSDDGVNMGLYTYPVLMAADILLFDTDYVPVGSDQFQHIEMAQDIAQSFNYNYGKEYLKIPQAIAREETKTLLGLDGRKMSKSYGNTIPMFASEEELYKLVMRIKTNSQTVEEPKDPETCTIFAIYRNFATPDQTEALRRRYLAGGMSWKEAKEELFNVLNAHLTPLRERYNELISQPDDIKRILEEGSARARELAAKKIKELRQVIGVD